VPLPIKQILIASDLLYEDVRDVRVDGCHTISYVLGSSICEERETRCAATSNEEVIAP
jgi:hypothetical protein